MGKTKNFIVLEKQKKIEKIENAKRRDGRLLKIFGNNSKKKKRYIQL